MISFPVLTLKKNAVDRTKYDTIIGLEIHIQTNTQTKMFCSCPTHYFGKESNTHVCPVCLGLPGALPVPNKRAIELCILMGLATNCDIEKEIHFDRKHYFYPDLPKGYQISQYKRPICSDGYVNIKDENGKMFKVEIERIHQEEDVAKSTHHTESSTGMEYSLIDYNKSGVPLIEIVTKPNIRSAYQAKEYASRIRQIARYLGISDADMEKGQMRCEPNISVQEKGKWEYIDGKIVAKEGYTINPKVEIKNIGSISFVEKSIEYEVNRLIKEIEEGKEIIQQTRGWNADKGITEFQRSKETADDYRYMPEPDIPVIDITEEDIERVGEEMVELPEEKMNRFLKKGLTVYQSEIMVSDPVLAESFEEFQKHLEESTDLKTFSFPEDSSVEKESNDWMKEAKGATGPAAANFIAGPVFSHLNATGQDYKDVSEDFEDFKDFAKLIEAYEKGELTKSKRDEIAIQALETHTHPNKLLDDFRNEAQKSSGNLEDIIDEVINSNPKAVEDFKAGKQASIGFLVGQVMQKTKGTADPNTAKSILMEKLNG